MEKIILLQTDNATFRLQFGGLSFLFCNLQALATNASTALSETGETVHLPLVSDFPGTALNLAPLGVM